VADLFDVLSDVRSGKYKRTMMSTDENAGKNKLVDTNNTKGKVIIRDGVIIFDNVPIVTPNSDVLVTKKKKSIGIRLFCFVY
jgi:ATP-binding cassette subfamily D (ALD) protein 3